MPFHFVPDDSGKLAFCLLRSFDSDHDFLANVSYTNKQAPVNAVNNSPIVISDDDDVEYALNRRVPVHLQNVVYLTSHKDSDENNEKENRSENVDELRADLLFDDDDEASAKFVTEYASEENVDNLPTTNREQFRELGVMFSECENGGDPLAERINSDTESVRRFSRASDSKTDPRRKDHFGFHVGLRAALKNAIRIPERKLSVHSLKSKHRPQYEETATMPRPTAPVFFRPIGPVLLRPVTPVSSHPVAPPPPRPVALKPEVRDLSQFVEIEVVPPLPPKRVKKNPTFSQNLPPLPEKQSKLAFVQKLLVTMKKKPKPMVDSQVSSNVNDVWKPGQKSMSEFRLSGLSNDLTEAEHYALYTDVAPRATVSEFDESSCYYSPVEMKFVKEESV